MTVAPDEVIGLTEPYKSVVRCVLDIEQSVGRRAVAGFLANEPSRETEITPTEAP